MTSKDDEHRDGFWRHGDEARGLGSPESLAVRRCGDGAALPQYALTFTFRCSTPHAVVEAVDQRVLEALNAYRAPRADALYRLHARAVGWKERRRVRAPAVCVDHPRLHAKRWSVSRVRIVSHRASTSRLIAAGSGLGRQGLGRRSVVCLSVQTRWYFAGRRGHSWPGGVWMM
jgi:hypothetical protein